MAASELLGYADNLSVAPGEALAFMVSTPLDRYRAQIVRLTSGPRQGGEESPGGEPLFEGSFAGRSQPIPIGSYVQVPETEPLRIENELTIQCWIYPTLPLRAHEQAIVAKWDPERKCGFALYIDAAGRLAMQVGDGSGSVSRVTAPEPVQARRWLFVAATADRESVALTWYEPRRSWITAKPGQARQSGSIHMTDAAGSSLLIGALALLTEPPGVPCPAGNFNGKIDRLRLWRRSLSTADVAALLEDSAPAHSDNSLVADWDFAADIGSTAIIDRSPNRLDGVAVNMPTRGVTDHTWDGSEDSFLAKPEQYGAIAFHEDDLEDCHWKSDLTFTVPDHAPSGVYAARLEADGRREEIPFYVRRRRDAEPAPILFLAPTNTYLAYANFRLNVERDELPGGDATLPVQLSTTDHLLISRPDLAASVYDLHCDGSGVCYSTRLRPVVNMRSDAVETLTRAPRHFSADLYLIEWLERLGLPYDVATDEDLHLASDELLAPYRVVVTGGHPEYWTTTMLDSLETYLAGDGRLMYLGGNGFYWVTAMDPQRPHLVEVRRGINGTRSWTSEPGESRLSLTGEIGGLWRYRGRSPNRLVGVGFTSQGWDKGSSYHRLEESFDSDAAFIFAGIERDEIIGAFGLVGNGAAGDEIDRIDYQLGTPPETLRLATSEGEHSDGFQLVVEDTRESKPDWGGSTCRDVRADLVYLPGDNGGAVFSVGSINWIASLPHNDFDNNVARITENVLRKFAEPR